MDVHTLIYIYDMYPQNANDTYLYMHFLHSILLPMDYNCRHIIYKMKRVVSTIVLSLLHLTLFAHAGSSLSYAYRPGDIIHRYGIEDFCIGTKGENQIWDFSNLRTKVSHTHNIGQDRGMSNKIFLCLPLCLLGSFVTIQR